MTGHEQGSEDMKGSVARHDQGSEGTKGSMVRMNLILIPGRQLRPVMT